MPPKSIGSSINGGKPPCWVAWAMICRANGNKHPGHSISTTGCSASWVRSRYGKCPNRPALLQRRLCLHVSPWLPGGVRLHSRRRQGLGIDIDRNVDFGRACSGQRFRRVRIFERQILQILGNDAQRRGDAVCAFGPVPVAVSVLVSPPLVSPGCLAMLEFLKSTARAGEILLVDEAKCGYHVWGRRQ